ncbi:MAG: hypothetical protein LQ340_003130 [Diploschistes diacapsis]|nr:MAG: hypothetical protein LQ340_003130 [Diploschistes diacapsis]
MVRFDVVEQMKGVDVAGAGPGVHARAGKMAIQSMMFSSTWQILESYLEDSPTEARKTLQLEVEIVKRKERASPMVATTTTNLDIIPEMVTPGAARHPFAKPLPKSPEFPTSADSTDSSGPSESSSLAASPASSRTSAFSDEYPVKPTSARELRWRRSPDGAEPRPKNLSLTKSNGATSLSVKAPAPAPVSATSNYDDSPSIESPTDLPPPPPPKVSEKLAQRVPVTRKPVQAPQVTPNERRASLASFIDEKPESKRAAPALGENPGASRAPVNLSLQQSGSSRNDNLALLPTQPQGLPSRTDSLAKAAVNFPNPKQGLRPARKKSGSVTFQNKELPPNPPFLEVAAIPVSQSLALYDPPEEIYELPSLPSEKMAGSFHARGKSNTALDILKALRAESPVEETSRPIPPFVARKPGLENSRGYIDPIIPQDSAFDSFKPSGFMPEPTWPSLPRTDSSTSQSSLSSLTSSSLAAPFPQPNFVSRSRARNSDARVRSRSSSNGSQTKRSKTPQPQRPEAFHRATSSESINSFRQKLDVPSQSTNPQALRSHSPQPSISSLPDVPEPRSPLIAPELKPAHFSCYTQHRPLLLSSNVLAPVLCMTCKHDSDQMWKCGWCCLRICSGCKVALVEMNGNLKRTVDEHQRGHLKIGQDRAPEVLPMERSNTPASTISNRSNPRSQPFQGNDSNPNQHPGSFPNSLATSQNRGPPPVGARPYLPMRVLRPQPMPARPEIDPQGRKFSFDPVMPPNAGQPAGGNGRPLPPVGFQRAGGAPFGDIPIGLSMGKERRRALQQPPFPANVPKAATINEEDGEVTPDVDLGIDAGPGAMAAGMRAFKPDMPHAGPRLPTNPVLGFGLGSLGNGKLKGIRERFLMA